MRSVVLILINALILSAGETSGNELISTSPACAQVFFIQPSNGQVVSRTFTVKFGLKGMKVKPAGVKQHNSGHHHLLIDLTQLPELTLPLPSTDQIRHFGGGETETELTLAPGRHTLQLLLGNHVHVPHDKPVMSEIITVTVK